MGAKDSPPPPPDYSGLIAVNEKTANMAMKLARDQFDWARAVYNENKDLTRRTGESFLSTMENSRKAFEEDRARYKAQYQPLEDRMIRDARTYDTPERRDRDIGEAQANVAQSFEAARNNATQQLESYGINPSATRFAALDLGMRTQEAAAKAAAGTTAGKQAEERGRALTALAVDVGRGYPGQYTTAAREATLAGNAANQGSQGLYQTGAAAMGTGPQWLGGANQALGNWGSLLNNQYANQLGFYNAEQNASSGLGSFLGLGLGMAGKYFGFDEGGAVDPSMSPTRGAEEDDVPAAVSVGEFIVPKETVSWYGEKHFRKLIEKAEQERADSEAVPTAPRPYNEAIPTPT